MKKIIITNRPVWVGGVVRTPGESLDVSDSIANEMCGALGTARLFNPETDAPKEPMPETDPEATEAVEAAVTPEIAEGAEPAKKGKAGRPTA